MNAEEMKYAFNVKLDVLASYSAPGLTDDEISVFLNLAQDDLVREIYKTSGSELLTELIDTFTSSTALNYTDIKNAAKYEWSSLSENLFILINSAIKISRTNPDITSEWLECETISKRISHNFAETTFNKPWFEKPKLFLDDDKAVVIVDGYTKLLKSIGDIENAIFTGSGLNDITTGGSFIGSTSKTFFVEIDSIGSTDTFRWSTDNGETWKNTNVDIAETPQTLEDGVTISFGATTGHTLGNYWTIDVTTNLLDNPVKINYIKVPARIDIGSDIGCKLRDILHDDVVERAAYLAVNESLYERNKDRQ